MATINQLLVKKLTDKAIIPTRGSIHAAGLDLYAAYPTTIPARTHALIKTDIAVAIPYGTYARVAPRSGLALKNGIDVGAGVIDYDYRGNVGVILFNHNDSEFVVKEGDRIAQLILEKIVMADPVEVAADEDLPSTERGSGGFGSTGVNGEEVKKPRI